MQLGRAASRRNCKSNQTNSWDEQLATVQWRAIVNSIKQAADGRRTIENNFKFNQTCSSEEQLAVVRWKTILNLIKHAVGESRWSPRDGKLL